MSDKVLSSYDNGQPATFEEEGTGKPYTIDGNPNSSTYGQKTYLSPRAVDPNSTDTGPYSSGLLGGGSEWNSQTGQWDKKSNTLEKVTLLAALAPFAAAGIGAATGGGGSAASGGGVTGGGLGTGALAPGATIPGAGATSGFGIPGASVMGKISSLIKPGLSKALSGYAQSSAGNRDQANADQARFEQELLNRELMARKTQADAYNGSVVGNYTANYQPSARPAGVPAGNPYVGSPMQAGNKATGGELYAQALAKLKSNAPAYAATLPPIVPPNTKPGVGENIAGYGSLLASLFGK